MLAEPEISVSSRIFIFVSWWKISCWEKKVLSAILVHICHYNWYVKSRKSYMPLCLYSKYFLEFVQGFWKFTGLITFPVLPGMQIFSWVQMFDSLKYENILLLQDVIFILDTLKYFNILSLLSPEVFYSFCIINWSRLSGNNYEFSYFPKVWQNIYLKRTWEMENHHC